MITTDIDYKSNTLAHLPHVYRKIKEFRELANTYDKENELIARRVQETFDNFFILSLNEYGCSRWEKILKIKVNDSYTLEDRRFNILTKLIGLRPYTKKKLKYLLDALVGEGNYTSNIDNREKILEVNLGLAAKNQMRALEELLDNILPANMVIKTSLKYNKHEMLTKYTHQQLEKATHEQLREEVLANVIV